MEHGAPAPFAMRIDQIIDVGRDTRLRQRAHHKVPLPGAIALPVPMLHGAAAATAEMRADRGDPLCARALDPQQAAPGSAYGTNTGPAGVSATPSPRWPRWEMVRCSVTQCRSACLHDISEDNVI